MSTPEYENVPDSSVSQDGGELSVSEWRRSVSSKLNAQAKIEAERVGASKLTAKLITVFGSLITAAAIGVFAWLWNAHTQNQLQDSQIARLDEKQTEHTHVEDSELDRRVSGVESATKNIDGRLDRQERRMQEILTEVTRHNNPRNRRNR